jgi:hypothetical protein
MSSRARGDRIGAQRRGDLGLARGERHQRNGQGQNGQALDGKGHRRSPVFEENPDWPKAVAAEEDIKHMRRWLDTAFLPGGSADEAAP